MTKTAAITNENGISRWGVGAQTLYLLLSAAWNFAGVYLVSQGGQPLGPVASVTTAIILLAFIPPLLWSARNLPPVHLLIAVLIMLAAGSTIWGSITGEAAQWPSPFWRWAGAAINAIGLTGALASIASYFRSR